MASTIKLKNGTGVPLVGDLVQGEPALDLTNKRLYTEDAGGTVIEVGTNPSTLNVVGAATFGGDVVAMTGSAAGSVLKVNHLTTGTYPKASGISFGAASTGLSVASNGSTVFFGGGAGVYANNTASSDNPTELRFWTTQGGSPSVKMTLDASGNLSIGTALAEDSVGVYAFGTSAELRIKDGEENGTAQISIYNINTTEDLEQFFVAMNGADVDIGNKREALKLFAGGSERARIDTSGNLSIATGKLNIATTVTPATASSAGTTGDIVWDASYIYVCTATNTWKRTAIATW